MTAPFQVPSPSEAAVKAYWQTGAGLCTIKAMIYAAYAVDFPAAVRAEVERAMKELSGGPYAGSVEEAYLAARFPEAAPRVIHVAPGGFCNDVTVARGQVWEVVNDGAKPVTVNGTHTVAGGTRVIFDAHGIPTPPAPEREERDPDKPVRAASPITCGHVQYGTCAACLAENIRRQSASAAAPSAPAQMSHKYRHDCFCDGCEDGRRDMETAAFYHSPTKRLCVARYSNPPISGCTACACPKHQAMEAFVMALAHIYETGHLPRRVDAVKNTSAAAKALFGVGEGT